MPWRQQQRCWSCVLFHLLLLLKYTEAIPTTLEEPFTPTTVHFDRSLRRGSNDLLPNDTRLARRRPPPFPEQVALALSKPGAMWISWITGDYQLAEQVFPLNTTGVNSIVTYGTVTGVYDKMATGNATVYSQIYPFEGLLNYTSGYIHHVLVPDLHPSTTYFYRCGASLEYMSDEYNFTTLPAPSSSSYPNKVAVVGDLGLTINSTTTAAHVLQSKPDLLLMLGDLSYADQYVTNGTGSDCFSCSFTDSPIRQTYQPHWDHWSRFMEPLTAFTPMMVIEGNHEVEPQIGGKTFEAYKTRFAVAESSSESSLYYSFDAGGIHIIMLGAYVDYNKTSSQYIWLKSDLEKVDRSITPWVVMAWHPPWYNSFSSHYREAECMRLSMEDLLYQYKVDIVFNGHVHAYERMNRVYNNELDSCGPLYITIGDGGNIEKVDVEYADDMGKCPEPSPDSCPSNFTSGPAAGSFCWNQQPEWSALRDSSFGHGLLEVKNETHALWTWNRNQDAYEGHTKGDEIYIVRQPDLCMKMLHLLS